VRSRGYEPTPPGVTLQLGGPWAFYQAFWPAHNIEHLARLYAPEAQVSAGETLWVPLIIRNDTDLPCNISVHAALPVGWKQKPETTTYAVAPHDSFPVQLTLSPPESSKGTWHILTWNAESDGKSIGSATLRVNMANNGLPQ
jgi:hypothetical protein